MTAGEVLAQVEAREAEVDEMVAHIEDPYERAIQHYSIIAEVPREFAIEMVGSRDEFLAKEEVKNGK